MPHVKIKELDIFYSDQGEGQPILFVHGLGINSRIFEDQAEFFKPNYRVIRYDLRGHGESQSPETGYSYQDYADELRDLIEHFSLADFHLVGLSMGGAVAAKYLIDNPGKAKSITFVGAHITGFYQFEGWPNLFKTAQTDGVEEARETWKNFRLFETVRPFYRRFPKLMNMVDNFSCTPWLDPNFRYKDKSDLERLDRIDIPALITIGKSDRDFYPIAQILKDKLPNNRFEEFDCGHLVSYEKPDEFNSVLNEFISTVV